MVILKIDTYLYDKNVKEQRMPQLDMSRYKGNGLTTFSVDFTQENNTDLSFQTEITKFKLNFDLKAQEAIKETIIKNKLGRLHMCIQRICVKGADNSISCVFENELVYRDYKQLYVFHTPNNPALKSIKIYSDVKEHFIKIGKEDIQFE